MKSNRRFYIALTTVVLIMVVFWLSTSIGQTRRRYEVEAQVYSTPEYRTDTTRAIEAYERLMERYMDVTERNFSEVSGDIGAIAVMLDRIDAKMAKLDTRLERIERHLGILPSPVAPDPNAVPASAPRVAPVPSRPPSTQYR